MTPLVFVLLGITRRGTQTLAKTKRNKQAEEQWCPNPSPRAVEGLSSPGAAMEVPSLEMEMPRRVHCIRKGTESTSGTDNLDHAGCSP